MHAIQQQPLAFWKTVLTSFLLWPAAFKKVLPFSIGLSLLSYVAGFIVEHTGSEYETLMSYISWIYTILVGLLLCTVTFYSINSLLTGNEISIKDAFIRGVKKLGDQLALFFIICGMLMVLGLLIMLCAKLNTFLDQELRGLALITQGVFILAGVSYICVRTIFAFLILAIKDFKKETPLFLRIKACFIDSHALVKHYWWRTLGILVIAFLCTIIPELCLLKIFASTESGIMIEIVCTIVDIIIFPIVSVFMLVLFYDLKTRHVVHK